MKFQDLTGNMYNKLTVISYKGKNSTGQSLWVARCECGNTKIVTAHHMKSNSVKSCGCLASPDARANYATRHGGTKTPEYESFHAAKKRCNPEKAEEFPDHAGRGIEFRYTSFKEFLEDVGPRPEPKAIYSLDRIDNDGHYEIGNCQWATRLEQARNRRCGNCERLKEHIKELEKRLSER